MTLGVGIQGNGWAVLATDSLYQTFHGHDDQAPTLSRHSKIFRWGPATFVAWAGIVPEGTAEAGATLQALESMAGSYEAWQLAEKAHQLIVRASAAFHI